MQVIDANGPAANLVLVSRTNAAARGADLSGSRRSLAYLIKFAV